MSKELKKAERIWRTVLAIPHGKVASYGQVADLAGLPGRARYVGKAMAYAPESVQLPWHRVLRSNGQLAFKTGSQHALTQAGLLANEGVSVNRNRVNMNDFGWKPGLGEMLAKLEF